MTYPLSVSGQVEEDVKFVRNRQTCGDVVKNGRETGDTHIHSHAGVVFIQPDACLWDMPMVVYYSGITILNQVYQYLKPRTGCGLKNGQEIP